MSLRLPYRRTAAAALVLLGVALLAGEAAEPPSPLPAVDAIDRADRRALADGLYARGLYLLALPEYEALVAGNPPSDLDVLLYRLAECTQAAGRAAEAEALYRRLAADIPASPYRARAVLKRGLIAIELKQYESAAEMLDRLAAEATDPAILGAALFHAGEAFDRLERAETASARFTDLRRRLPESEFAAFAGLRLAAAAARGADPVAARRAAGALYREVAAGAKDPRVAAEALFQGAMLDYQAGDFAASVPLFLQLAARFPDDLRRAEALHPSAWAYLHTGHYAEALQGAARALADPAIVATPARFEWLYLKANCERQLERRADALASYDKLLAEAPDSSFAPAARYERLLTLFREGRYDEVLTSAAAFVAPPPDLADDVLWLQAEAATAKHDTDRAIQFYRLLLRDYADSDLGAEAGYRLGYQLQEQRVWVEASRAYLELATRHPKHTLAPRALFASGLCLAQAGQGDGALRDWHALLTRYPDHECVAETLYQKAIEELRRQQPRDASASLDELLRRFPGHARRADALFWRASIFQGAGELKDAEQSLRLVLAAHPSKEIEREANFLLGMVLQQTGREGEAAAVFQPLLDAPIRAKFSPERLCWLAEFQFGRGVWRESEEAARTLLAAAPDPGWQQAAWTLIGRAQRAQSHRDDAIAAFRRAVELSAETRFGAEAALRLGELLLDAGQTAEAESRLADAARRAASPELQSLRAHAYAALGRAAEGRGDGEAAVRYYLSVGILFDDATLVPETLGRAAHQLQRLGRTDACRATAAELCQRYPDSQAAGEWRRLILTPQPAATNPPAGAAP